MDRPIPRPPLRPAQSFGLRRSPRVIMALVFREMSTTYGQSSLGYLWALLEPLAGILLLTLVFSLAFRSPSIGTSFPLFYASGLLPYLAYQQISQKISQALRFSRPLLFYPRVTFIDALLARLILNALTQVMIFVLVLAGILIAYRIDVILNIPAIALSLAMSFSLAFGVGVLNCYLFWQIPIWRSVWKVVNRPMFVLSCVLFIFDDVPQPYQDWLWWNPLVHVVGMMRSGIYATYDSSYVSPLYVFLVALATAAFGLLQLHRWHRNIVED
ncbi:ABC transporter permease [Frigidibacter sp. ROC022]|uniref:ABC transporter permease n=1 Tax=Frigidibacter sp. ROC022 TaxID=2971796 RepID=UPI00215AB5DB|nr:ABC transporter permease [Frigidibacter sp. ROC022]MCR8726848.1 ABC transporter permease [Frigidibacter sp. ROC022]